MVPPQTTAVQTSPNKRLWDVPVIGPMAMTLAVFATSVLLVWGIKTFISSANKGHRELIQDLENKSFGNKWVSALELTKVLAQNKNSLSFKESVWILDHLTSLYQFNLKNKGDERLRHFIICAASLLPSQLASKIHELLAMALLDPNSQVQLSAVSGLSSSASSQHELAPAIWERLESSLLELTSSNTGQKDELLQQAILLLYAQQGKIPRENLMESLFVSASGNFSSNIICAAALTLIPKQSNLIIDILSDTLKAGESSSPSSKACGVDAVEREKWIMNFLSALYKYPWPYFQGVLENLVRKDSTIKNLEIINYARVVLKKWGAT